MMPPPSAFPEPSATNDNGVNFGNNNESKNDNGSKLTKPANQYTDAEIQAIANDLTKGVGREHQDAKKMLIEIGIRVEDFVIPYLERGGFTQAGAAIVLQEISSEKSIPALRRAVQRGGFKETRQALEKLETQFGKDSGRDTGTIQSGDPESTSMLSKPAADYTDAEILAIANDLTKGVSKPHHDAKKKLIEIGIRVEDIVIPFLKKDAFTQAGAAYVLAQIGSIKSIPHLKEAVSRGGFKETRKALADLEAMQNGN